MTTKRHTSSAADSATVSTRAAALSPARSVAREVGLILAGTAALVLIGQLAVPLPFTPVPVTLGTFAALGVGATLGSRRGTASALLLAGLAAANVPVLAGWSAGVGASFGYVLGYAPAAAIAGLAARPWGRGQRLDAASVARTLGLMLAASAAVYIPGLIWLKVATGVDWSTALVLGMLPFLVGDTLKSLAMTGLAPLRSLRAQS
ncbi:biotin transporter BioY [Actinomyces slackii]|uniref:Biotin ECF transporter S component BioY2 n=1 Tax=Actinomyces slackii TaxID=52774 RepID=A0A3S4WI69_9ACTO|nr:biotin transporter BioY [Actinomyces slackii]VEG73418.1 Biotin ECF transporter S component BioY2 [Actinomyces slackii]